MIVELIGPSGAGKSTLASSLRDELGGPPRASLASDLVLDRPVLRRLHSATATNLVQDACGLPYLVRAVPRHLKVLKFSTNMLLEHAPSRFDLAMNVRSVMRRIGMFELARSTAEGRVVILDEGPVLIAYHLFVYSRADLATAPLERFAELTPLPDVVVYVRSPVPVLVSRAFSRPDRRRQLAGMTPAEAEGPLRRAVDVFDRLVSTSRVGDRTVVVENGADRPEEELRRLAAHLGGGVRSGTGTTPTGPGPARREVRR